MKNFINGWNWSFDAIGFIVGLILPWVLIVVAIFACIGIGCLLYAAGEALYNYLKGKK